MVVVQNWYFVNKIVLTTVIKIVRDNILKFEAEGRKFAKVVNNLSASPIITGLFQPIVSCPTVHYLTILLTAVHWNDKFSDKFYFFPYSCDEYEGSMITKLSFSPNTITS